MTELEGQYVFDPDTLEPQWTIALQDELRPFGAYSFDLISLTDLGFFDGDSDLTFPPLSLFVLENALDGEMLVGRMSDLGDRFIVSLVGEAIPLPAAGWLFFTTVGTASLLRRRKS